MTLRHTPINEPSNQRARRLPQAAQCSEKKVERYAKPDINY
ncbi:MAG: hypothetical protein AB1489_27760 [Acidobacteriota bacterium]